MTAAHFRDDQVVSITGETTSYNGLEVDGVGVAGLEGGITYHFCSTCGSTLYWDFVAPESGRRTYVVAVGNFVDPAFPTPAVDVFTTFRHHWVTPVRDALQVYDPYDDSVPIESVLPSARQDSDAE
jgi:hypothetical protein